MLNSVVSVLFSTFSSSKGGPSSELTDSYMQCWFFHFAQASWNVQLLPWPPHNFSALKSHRIFLELESVPSLPHQHIKKILLLVPFFGHPLEIDLQRCSRFCSLYQHNNFSSTAILSSVVLDLSILSVSLKLKISKWSLLEHSQNKFCICDTLQSCQICHKYA